MELSQVRAVVTGGASGMGKAAVQALVAEGGKVCIVDYNKEWGRELADELGENAYFEFADVSDPVRAEEIVKGAAQKFGYVNVVATCAGVSSGTRILPREGGVFPLHIFKRVLDINLVGTFNYICQGALAMTEAPGNEDGEHGVIINCSSLAATSGQIGQAAYAASKGGVNAMALPIARELARAGIRINVIQPGLVSTNISSVNQEDKPKVRRDHLPEDPNNPIAMSMARHFIFPRRQGRAAEFSSLVLEIIRNTLINGTVLSLDGAIRLSPK